MTPDELADAYIEALLLHARDAPGREQAVVDGVPVMTLGVAEEWGAQALALTAWPDRVAVQAAMAWLAARAASYVVTVRAAAGPVLSAIGLRASEELPALVRRPPGRPQTPLLIRLAGERGCGWVALHATSASLLLYRRLGFVLTDVHVHLTPDPERGT